MGGERIRVAGQQDRLGEEQEEVKERRTERYLVLDSIGR